MWSSRDLNVIFMQSSCEIHVIFLPSSCDLHVIFGLSGATVFKKKPRSGSALHIRNTSATHRAFNAASSSIRQKHTRCRLLRTEARLKCSELSDLSTFLIIFGNHWHHNLHTIQSVISAQFKHVPLCWYGGALMPLAYVTYTSGKTPSVQKGGHRF